MANTGAESFVRLFERSELGDHPDWPDDVGLAYLVKDGVPARIVPVHESEGAKEILARLGKDGGEDFEAFGIYPAAGSHPEARHGFAADQDLLRDIEKSLAESDELLEDADNFAVNFRFARDMGIALPTLPISLEEDEREAAANGGQRPAPEVDEEMTEAAIKGYTPYLEMETVPPDLASATIKVSRSRQTVLCFDGEGPAINCPKDHILLKSDRTGFALPLEACVRDGELASHIELPTGLLPASLAPAGSTIRPVVAKSGDLVQFTLSGAATAAKPARRDVLVVMALAACMVALLILFGAWAIDSFNDAPAQDGTVGALRSELFK